MSLSRGSCWEILELAPTDNKKSIKRAYHKLLRQYKPDEYPDEFKRLYQAYQEALEEKDYISDEEIDWNDKETLSWDNTENNEELWEETSEELDEFLSIEDDYYERWNSFKEKVDELTYNNNYPELFNQQEKWDFLEELDVISDLEFYKEASHYLFNAVTKFDEKHKRVLLNEEVIRYFDSIFLWKKQWSEFDQESTVFEYLEIKKELLPHERKKILESNLATIEQRLFSFFLDLVVALTIAIFFNELKLPSAEYVFITYAIMTIAIFWILGLKTPGQFATRLEVLEGLEKEKPTKVARGIRLIFTFISIIPLFYFFEEEHQSPLLYTLIAATNIALLFHNERLLQDYSGTRIYSTEALKNSHT